jgi:predicted amidophosphoribosyltransferase
MGMQFALAEKRERGAWCGPKVLVPVPLHPKKLKIRGFNQSEWIAKGMAEIMGCPLDLELLYRAQESGSQTKLDSASRTKNAADQYACSRSAEREVAYILVDDMITTGATLEACAGALRRAGAECLSIRGLACDLDI